MKNVFLLLLVSAIFLATSCKKDDDGPQLTQDNVVGTWDVTAMDMDGVIGLGVSPIFQNSDVSSSISNSMLTVTFKADGTWTSAGSYTLTSTNGTDTTTTTESDMGSGTYTVANGKIAMVGVDFSDDADVNEQTFEATSFQADKKIVLKSDTNVTESDPIFGLDVKVDVVVNMTLEK